MSPNQEHLIEVIKNQPEDSTWSELLEQLFFQKIVDEGLEDLREGRVLSNQVALVKIRSWR